MSQPVVIASDEVTARIDPLGAQLVSLVDSAGREHLWQGDPAWWAGQAPVLFPIVGALNGGQYRLDGRAYALPKHGFARTSPFAVQDPGPEAVTFAMHDSDATRAIYPFAFGLELDFRVIDRTLSITAEVANRGDGPMPFSFGFHPAFAWPLPGGAAKEAHRLVFAQAEPGPLRRIDAAGLLRPEHLPSPIVGDTLAPAANLFTDDALIFPAIASRSCSFGAPGGGAVALAWRNCPVLGVWQKPGAPFLAIEPWHGIADPQGFTGDLFAKPAGMVLAAGQKAHFHLDITVIPPEQAA